MKSLLCSFGFLIFGISLKAQTIPGYYVDRDVCNNDYTAILNILNEVRTTPTQNLTMDFVKAGQGLEILVEPLEGEPAHFKAIRVTSSGDKAELQVIRSDAQESKESAALEKRIAQDFLGPLFEVISHSRFAERDGLLIEPCVPGRCIGPSGFVASEEESMIAAPPEQRFRIKISDLESEQTLVVFDLADGILARRRSLREATAKAPEASRSSRVSRQKICIQFGKEDICPIEHRVDNSMEDLGRAELDTQSPEFLRLEAQFNQLVQQVGQMTRRGLENEGLPTTAPLPVRSSQLR